MANEGKTTQSQQFQRRTIIIKKGMQYRYMAVMFFTVFIGFLIVIMDSVWNLSRIVAEHPMLEPILKSDLAPMMPLFLMKVALFFIVVLIAAGVISHKMAGPIYKFEKSAEIIGRGDFSHRIFLRKGDQMTELQEAINAMLANLQAMVKKDRRAAQDAAARLDQLAAQAQDPALKDELLRIKDEVSGITGGFSV